MEKQNLKIDKKQEKQAGITLVALVITVVVMLILAGVAIAAVVDGDGLFSKTREAAETYENAADKEGYMLENLMGQIDYYIQDSGNGDGVDPGDDEEDQVESQPIVNPINQKVPVNQTYSGGTTGSYSDPIIPKGFKPVENAQDSTITADAVWGSADGYQKGLVIEDESGNQFVWIPVDGTTVKFERYDFGKQVWGPAYSDYSDHETQELINITSSVTTNGGFYIGRYEAGRAENMPQEELSSDSSATYGTGEYKPVSQQGAIVWNCIQWGDENNDETPGNGAVTVARSMYPVADTNYGVASTLIYATQWDTALKFIGAYGGDAEYATNSAGKGNYDGTENGDPSSEKPDVCGAYDVYRQKNIYDMAGNVWEWTMEKCGSIRAIRGGSYSGSGSGFPASSRNSNNLDVDGSYERFSCSALYKAALNPKEKRSN